jgi:hypothetical protein
MIHTPASLRASARHLDRQNQHKQQRAKRAQRVLEGSRPVLFCTGITSAVGLFGRWCGGGGNEFLTHEVITDARLSGHLVGLGDALPFAGTELSQTYRYTE